MTIFEMYSILLNTVVAVLVVGYGIWLRNVFKHQISAKDATIETFETALKAKDGEIARLTRDTAPAIAAAYDIMRKHADKMTADFALASQRLQEQTNIIPQVS